MKVGDEARLKSERSGRPSGITPRFDHSTGAALAGRYDSGSPRPGRARSAGGRGRGKERSRRVIVALVALLLGVGCDAGDSPPAPAPPPEPLETGTLSIEAGADTVQIRVEIANTATSRAYGLMDRDSLGRGEGMLFVFDEDRPGDAPFYMYRTRIPLDIAFIDAEGVLVSILTMEPCPYPVASFCPTYAPGTTYRLALEVNAGYFAELGVTAGGRIVGGP